VSGEIIKFDEFEVDLGRYELRRRGRAIKLEKIPMELLILLAQREGQLVTREEITRKLWGDDVFVDTRQGINTAIRKIRLALRDDPDEPRILQTVVGKGYRLNPLAPARTSVSLTMADPTRGVYLKTGVPAAEAVVSDAQESSTDLLVSASGPNRAEGRPISPALARGLFLLIQAGYLALYAYAFRNFGGIQRLGLPPAIPGLALIAGLAGAATRLYLISAVVFDFAGSGRLFRQIFPGLLALDTLWAASPLLLYNRLGEVTLLFVACLAFLPFSQRTLMLCAYGSGRNKPS
jgi:DNA-binding winged helix-turn-helix (wHTH) protein